MGNSSRQSSRVGKSLLNARVNVSFYILTLFLAFFSRKIFLDCLGADFVGLTGAVGNLLSFLNLAELGIGIAVSYILYTPLFRKDQERINEIISILGYLYQRIGLLILAGGVVLGCFLPLIFRNTDMPLGIIFLVYAVYLVSSLITYFINFRQTLLSADQRYYVISAYSQSSKLAKTLVQMAVTYYTQNYYYWIIIELVFSLVYSIALNKKINRIYPWLKTSLKQGGLLLVRYPEIKVKVKQIFIQKVAFLIQARGIPFLIYAFASLQVVAYYGNYTLITIALASLLYQAMQSLSSGVGNLIAEGKKEKIVRVFWEIYALRFYLISVASIVIFLTIHPFISLWLGDKYLLNNAILILIILDMFVKTIRESITFFIEGYGLFDDVWSSCLEAIVSLFLALVLGYYVGIEGVLAGGLIGLSLNIFCWKPYYLFHRGFKHRVKFFYTESLKYLFSLLLCILACWYAGEWIKVELTGFTSWIIYAIGCSCYAGLLLALFLYITTRGFRDFIHRVYSGITGKR